MKKLLNKITTGWLALGLFVGCATIAALTAAQIATIGTVVTQVADDSAIYAIQQDKNNATYFKLANQVLDNFAQGTDLSPTALQAALAKVTSTNQWVNLAISSAVAIYDISYSQYISSQLANTPAAKAWILDAEAGFKQALASTGTSLKIAQLPSWYKNGIVDKVTLKAKIDAAVKAGK
jgi:hypothetical protein